MPAEPVFLPPGGKVTNIEDVVTLVIAAIPVPNSEPSSKGNISLSGGSLQLIKVFPASN